MISVIFITGLFFFFHFRGFFIIDKSEREKFISEIKNSPQLPEKFYTIYNIIHPHSLEPKSWMHFINHQAGENRYCACRELVYAGLYPFYTKAWDIIPIITMVEKYATQEECLNYYIHKKIEGENIDIQNINELGDSEIAELILLIDNPSYYNKMRYPERVHNRVSEILNKLNK